VEFPDFCPADKECLIICATWDSTNSTCTPWQGVRLSLQELELQLQVAKEETELSLLYPGICANLFLQLPKANPHLAYLLFERTEQT